MPQLSKGINKTVKRFAFGVEVHADGKILQHGRILSQYWTVPPRQQPFLRAYIKDDEGKYRSVNVATMVARAFLTDGASCRLESYRDGNPHNVAVGNLCVRVFNPENCGKKKKTGSKLDNDMEMWNEARKAAGLPLLKAKTFTCRACNKEFTAAGYALWCNSCRHKNIDDGWFGISL